MASSTSENRRSSSQPSCSAPRAITSREHPAAKCLSLNFLRRLDTSMSVQLPDGRMRAAAPIKPVNSSAAKRIFSISCPGAISVQMPYPCEQTAWIMASQAPASRNNSGDFLQCSPGYSSKSISWSSPTVAQKSASSAYPSFSAKYRMTASTVSACNR